MTIFLLLNLVRLELRSMSEPIYGQQFMYDPMKCPETPVPCRASGHRSVTPCSSRCSKCSSCNRLIFTLGARDFSSVVSGFYQIFAARGFGLRPKMCQPLANTENSRSTQEKPLVPRVESIQPVKIIWVGLNSNQVPLMKSSASEPSLSNKLQ